MPPCPHPRQGAWEPRSLGFAPATPVTQKMCRPADGGRLGPPYICPINRVVVWSTPDSGYVGGCSGVRRWAVQGSSERPGRYGGRGATQRPGGVYGPRARRRLRGLLGSRGAIPRRVSRPRHTASARACSSSTRSPRRGWSSSFAPPRRRGALRSTPRDRVLRSPCCYLPKRPRSRSRTNALNLRHGGQRANNSSPAKPTLKTRAATSRTMTCRKGSIYVRLRPPNT
jgi:hypothetical protein